MGEHGLAEIAAVEWCGAAPGSAFQVSSVQPTAAVSLVAIV